jgi:pimeloyl-ACP methyl ester carboxylesterase
MPILQISDGHVEYLELGSGDPVILLHSSASSSTQWRSLAERLSERYRVIAPDLYSYGGTSHWPGRRPFHLECEAEIVVALLKRANQPAHLIGHSYGGAVALHVAGLRRDLLRSLTLIEPVAFHLLKETDALALAEITAIADNVLSAIVRGDYVAGLECFVDYWGGPEASARIPAETRVAMAARLPKIALEFHATLNEPRRLEDFRSLALSTQILYGSHSPRPARRICGLLERILPEVTLKTIAGAGHMAPMTHRNQVNAMIVAHLEANSRRTPPQTTVGAPRLETSAASAVLC